MKINLKDEFHRYNRYFVSLKEFSQKKPVRSFTNLTLSMLTIAFFAFFAIKPTVVIIASLTKEIKDKQEIRTKIKSKITSLVQAQETYSLNQDRFYLLDQSLPDIPDFPSLIFPLEKEATLNNIQIRSFSITVIDIIPKGKTKDKASVTSSFDFNISATGDYQNLKAFLVKLKTLRRLLTIERASFGQTKKSRDQSITTTLAISGSSSFYPKEN